MSDRPRIMLVVLVALGMLAPHVTALEANDAGSGTDAGNKRSAALTLSSDGSYDGALAPADEDWYDVERSALGAGCVSYRVSPQVDLTANAVYGTAGGQRTLTASVASGDAWRVGIASSKIQRAALGLSEGPADASAAYSFALRSVTLDEADAELSDDAGSTISNAIELTKACAGGSLTALSGVVDQVDVFSLSASAGDTIFYSLAASASGLKLSLLDPSGAQVGYAVDPDTLAGYYVTDGGTYYLAAQRTQGSGTLDYALGLAVGPDPGSSCRPGCFYSST